MSQCNYCTLQSVTIRAAKAEQAVSIVPSKYGGVDVYVHPSDVPCTPTNENFHKQYWRMWFMSLSEECTCHT